MLSLGTYLNVLVVVALVVVGEGKKKEDEESCYYLDFGPGSGVFYFISQKRFIGILQHCFCVTGDRLVLVCCGLNSSYFKH